MTIDSIQLILLFKKYGFEYKKSSSGRGFYAFTFKAGFFHNAEVVYTDEANLVEVEKCLSGLDNIGYSTKKSLFESIEDVAEQLFNGFFNVDDWKERIATVYDRKRSISRVLSGETPGSNDNKTDI